MPRKADRIEHRVIEGIRVSFEYDRVRKDIYFEPDADDVRTCTILSWLRFVAKIDAWAQDTCKRNPGWSVNGNRPGDEPSDDALSGIGGTDGDGDDD